MKKIILMGVICGLMLSVSGCNTSDNKEKAVRYITEKKSVEKTETTTETKDYKKLINTVYAQLGNNDKKSVVNINEAKVKKINIKSEKNIASADCTANAPAPAAGFHAHKRASHNSGLLP